MDYYKIISDSDKLPEKISRDAANAILKLSKIHHPTDFTAADKLTLAKEFGKDWAYILRNIKFKLKQIK